MKSCRIGVLCLLFFVTFITAQPVKTSLEPFSNLHGDEFIETGNIVPYVGGRQSPGDQIGTTWYDYQASGSFGQRIDVDDLGQAHIVWMKMDGSAVVRYIAWNLRYADGSYFGETQATPSWSGYCQMDITRDSDPYEQKTVIAYHQNRGGGYWSWIEIMASYEGSPQVDDHIWPYVAVANDNNIILATGDYGGNMHHLYLTTDYGTSWTYITGFDSCATLSQFVRASEDSGSNKVVFVHTQFIADTIGSGSLDNDIYYILSTDGGVTWGSHINITNYQSFDSVRAYCNVNAVFDDNDNLHIAWAGRKVTDNYYQASKIYHWDEVSDTITVVCSPSIYYSDPGGWWIYAPGGGDYGAWRMPADQPQLVFDTINNYLYCLWHGNDDYNDYAADGYINGEFYGAYSTDYGITWSDYVNLTNTRSPGAGPGACHDEDYMTACLYVFNDSIWTTYIEDKDAGAYPHTEGVETENPVRCWVFPTSLITGIQENKSEILDATTLSLFPNPFVKSTIIDFSIGHPDRIENSSYGTGSAKGIELKIYDATGRVVKDFPRITHYALRHTLSWSGTDQAGYRLPAGVYFVEINTGDEIITRKVVKLR